MIIDPFGCEFFIPQYLLAFRDDGNKMIVFPYNIGFGFTLIKLTSQQNIYCSCVD